MPGLASQETLAWMQDRRTVQKAHIYPHMVLINQYSFLYSELLIKRGRALGSHPSYRAAFPLLCALVDEWEAGNRLPLDEASTSPVRF
jgi:hypothetical protein